MSYYQSGRPGRYGRPQSFSRGASKSRRPKKAYIHPSKFVKSAKPRAEAPYFAKQAFSDFDVHPLIHANLERLGFSDPTPIQDQTIPAGLEGRDIVGIANTGTGKTVAFAIPVLNRLLNERQSKALVLAPTRELAEQIEEQFGQIAKASGLYGALLIGGTPMGPQLRDLRNNPRIIVGTPGRVKDHLERRSLNLADCNVVVLDEVDRMLDMGFVNDISHILGRTSSTKQCFYFSATLDPRVNGIINGFSANPVRVTISSGEASDSVEQNIITFMSSSEKIDKLHDVLIQPAAAKTLVFDDTHRSVERLSKELSARGFSADSIHGGKTQAQRQRVFGKFKAGHLKVLVATDVAARGLDVADITHVINYSPPQSYDDYIHRIGRTGRAGKIGSALTFVEG